LVAVLRQTHQSDSSSKSHITCDARIGAVNNWIHYDDITTRDGIQGVIAPIALDTNILALSRRTHPRAFAFVRVSDESTIDMSDSISSTDNSSIVRSYTIEEDVAQDAPMDATLNLSEFLKHMNNDKVPKKATAGTKAAKRKRPRQDAYQDGPIEVSSGPETDSPDADKRTKRNRKRRQNKNNA
jgi:hypothetical protein